MELRGDYMGGDPPWQASSLSHTLCSLSLGSDKGRQAPCLVGGPVRQIGRLWGAWAQLGRSAQCLLATKAEQREPTRGGQVSHIHPVTQPSLSQESSPHPPLHHSAAPQESAGCHYQWTSSLETRGGPEMKWHLSREGAVMTGT